MPSSSPLPGSGPADALIAAGRWFRVEFDPQAVIERFEAHAEPRSLLAFIEIAGETGLEARAFRSSIADLAGITLPAMVHLDSAGEQTFALLVGMDPEGFLIDDPGRRREYRLGRDEFAGLWSGIVVLLKPASAPRPPAPGTWQSAIRRSVRSGSSLRAAAAMGVSFLALISAVRLEWRGTFHPVLAGAAAAAVLLILLGTAVSGILVASSRRSRVASATPSLASRLCGRGKLTDCEGVLASRFSRIGPIELAGAGFAFFASSLALAAAGAPLTGEPLAGLWIWLAGAFLAATPASLALVGVQIWPLRRICLLCMTVHGCVALCAGLGVLFLRTRPDPAGEFLRALPWALPHALAFIAVLALLIPLVEAEIENRTHRARLAWVSSTPWGALAETAGRPAVGEALDRSVAIGEPSAPFLADALVHPTCSGCPPILAALERLVNVHAGLLRVALHFPSRDPGEPADRHLCAALAAIGRVAGGEQALRVFELVKQDVWRWLRQARAGADPVVSAFLPGAAASSAPLAEAEKAVAAAERVLDLLRRGTPTLLLNGRPWDAPLEDLDALLTDHPEILAGVLGVRIVPAPASIPEERV